METSGYMQVLEESKSPPNPLIRQRYETPFVVREKSELSETEKKEITAILAVTDKSDVAVIAQAYGLSVADINKVKRERNRVPAGKSGKKKLSVKR